MGKGFICGSNGGICDTQDVPRGDKCQSDYAYKCPPSYVFHGTCDQSDWVCGSNCGADDAAAGKVCDHGGVPVDYKCTGAKWYPSSCVTAGLNASGTMTSSDRCDVLGNICPALSAHIV